MFRTSNSANPFVQTTNQLKTVFLFTCQVSVAAESKQRAEALRHKKKLEADVSELEIALAHAKRTHADHQAAHKKLQQQLAEQQAATEAEMRAASELREAQAASERHSHALLAALDELHAQLEQVRARSYSKRISSVVLLFYCLLEQFCEV